MDAIECSGQAEPNDDVHSKNVANIDLFLINQLVIDVFRIWGFVRCSEIATVESPEKTLWVSKPWATVLGSGCIEIVPL
ncbi:MULTISPECIES: hypothetical protein [unclassified Pseudomonas]|uniref:hypothetical protein n=1 Tax=unclassified Pseudomonas TaxID=196821 RepID=UPI00114D32B5|nr:MULTISPECIES: hypothetical protein [unclassified Pseudomonas]QIH10296.1 hypothetical protein ATY02_28005 [Pseudomonas sp. BIOMIG1BAC]